MNTKHNILINYYTQKNQRN